MTSVQNDLTELYVTWLSRCTLWFEEPNREDEVITLTAVDMGHEQHDFVEGVLVQMLGSKLVSVHTQPDTKRRFWRLAK